VPMWFEKPSQGFRIIATVKDEESRTENPQALVQKSSRGWNENPTGVRPAILRFFNYQGSELLGH